MGGWRSSIAGWVGEVILAEREARIRERGEEQAGCCGICAHPFAGTEAPTDKGERQVLNCREGVQHCFHQVCLQQWMIINNVPIERACPYRCWAAPAPGGRAAAGSSGDDEAPIIRALRANRRRRAEDDRSGPLRFTNPPQVHCIHLFLSLTVLLHSFTLFHSSTFPSLVYLPSCLYPTRPRMSASLFYHSFSPIPFHLPRPHADLIANLNHFLDGSLSHLGGWPQEDS